MISDFLNPSPDSFSFTPSPFSLLKYSRRMPRNELHLPLNYYLQRGIVSYFNLHIIIDNTTCARASYTLKLSFEIKMMLGGCGAQLFR